MITLKEKLTNIAIIMSMFALAGSIAPKAKAIPIETSNAPIFKQDWTGSVGGDYNINRSKTIDRAFNGNDTDSLFDSNDDQVRPRATDGVLLLDRNGTPSRRFVNGTPVFIQLNHGTYQDIVVTPDKIQRDPDTGSIANIDPTGATVIGTSSLRGICSSGSLVGANCQTQSKYSDVTAYGQGAVRTGGNTAILAGYDSNGRTAYAAGAIKLDNLAITAGGDSFGVTGSAAYSIGALSPFIAHQRGLTNYGIDYRFSDNFSLNGGYRTDSSYFAGFRLDVGGNFDRPVTPVKTVVVPQPAPKPDLTCEPGYRRFEDTCVKVIPTPTRPPVDAPIRGRG